MEVWRPLERRAARPRESWLWSLALLLLSDWLLGSDASERALRGGEEERARRRKSSALSSRLSLRARSLVKEWVWRHCPLASRMLRAATPRSSS